MVSRRDTIDAAWRGLVLWIGIAACLPAPSSAQTSLGGQRVGTASGTFLKIGVDARGAALGDAYVSLVEGPFSVFCNPAGLAHQRSADAAFGYARWPADVDVFAFSFARPWGESGSTLAVSAEYVGTQLDETTESHPQGTGRSFGYSDLLLGFSAARPFSDRLAIGGTVKFFREDLGSGIGGPSIQSWLVDAGTVYQIGTAGARLSIALQHFGPDLEPDGSYFSDVQGEEVGFAAFSPPTSFRIGLSALPYERGPHRLTTSTEVVHVSDNQETLRAGVEYAYAGRYFARTGYDSGADTMNFSAGLGLRIPWAGSEMVVDYAYTDGGPLLAIHRWSLVLPL
ncbi:MAG: PorV/PorQ family protein [Candidatus Eisenbacteria bacterium]|nr:PorV/PorQ family protein [Candidatus Latescibacterota bacterium]MBD3302761.1 PorV/PorQ family protein [Candidatus Eisenbacteria bacterium]